MKRKPRKLVDPVHNQSFFYFPGFKYEEVRSFIKSHSDVDIGENDDDQGFCVHCDDTKHIYIWIKNRADFSTFVHEVVHAVAYALHRRGYVFDMHQEAHSYLAGYLTEHLWGKK